MFLRLIFLLTVPVSREEASHRFVLGIHCGGEKVTTLHISSHLSHFLKRSGTEGQKRLSSRDFIREMSRELTEESSSELGEKSLSYSNSQRAGEVGAGIPFSSMLVLTIP